MTAAGMAAAAFADGWAGAASAVRSQTSAAAGVDGRGATSAAAIISLEDRATVVASVVPSQPSVMVGVDE